METVKICYERIIPKELDPLYSKVIAISKQLKENASKTKGALTARDLAHLDRMALIDTKKWKAGDVLSCKFLDGDIVVKKKVQHYAHALEEYANIYFKFVETGPAEIRITFSEKGSWSALGKDCLVEEYFVSHGPTMCYGWLTRETPEEEYSRVVNHEMCHSIGCIHEAASPSFSREWDVDAVYEAFSGSPNFWSKEQIDYNVLSRYSPEGISFTKFDEKSIMLYVFDSKLFSDNLGSTNNNTELSEQDKSMLRKMYPRDND